MAEPARSLWALADEAQAARRPRPRRFSWVPQALAPLVLVCVLGVAVLLPPGLSPQARLALFAFGAATLLWTLTGLNAAYVAMGAVLLLAVTGAIEQEELLETLESDVIWLMIGAFILGEAVLRSGLALRLTHWVCRDGRSVGAVCWGVTAALVPLAFLIPSTSGRAAVALPLFRTLCASARDRAVARALALLIPAVILVSTISSLVGAGSHLIANDLLDEVLDGQAIGFGAWALWGLPFGVVASALTCFVVGRLFLDAGTRRMRLSAPAAAARPWSAAEVRTLAVAALMVVLWLTQPLHGLEIATSSFLGAFVLMLPGAGVLGWKAGLKAIEWNLVFFVGAALVLGEALIETGAARWLIGLAFSASGLDRAGTTPALLAGLVLLTLTSHLYLTSHAARAAALVPPLLYLAQTLGTNPVAVTFIATVGMNYCLTFPVSSKALLMYQALDEPTWAPADLLRLSAVLLPAHAVLMLLFYYGWWRHTGLAL